MRRLSAQQSVNTGDSEFPYGRIRDDDGSLTYGTPVNEALYGDIQQFFARLMGEAIRLNPPFDYNNEPEGGYDGWQLHEALRLAHLGKWVQLTLTADLQNKGTPYYKPSYQIDYRTRTVKLRGMIELTNNIPPGKIVSTLPVGARPAKEVVKQVIGSTDSFATFANVVTDLWTIKTNGEITIVVPQLVVANDVYCLDGIEFSLDTDV